MSLHPYITGNLDVSPPVVEAKSKYSLVPGNVLLRGGGAVQASPGRLKESTTRFSKFDGEKGITVLVPTLNPLCFS